jgi:predicted flap endonuclease-1-like 5' DNA nuclease
MWIEQARLIVAGEDEALAELQDRLHRRQGDNLALVAGVGDKAKAALIAAGIASFSDLAATDEERLSSIIEGEGLRSGDYTAWREEAALRAAGKRVYRG